MESRDTKMDRHCDNEAEEAEGEEDVEERNNHSGNNDDDYEDGDVEVEDEFMLQGDDDDGDEGANGKWRERMYYDRDCSNNISRSLRVVPLEDVQISPGRDGYAYFFTSMAEGPMLSSMALQQILVLLHVIHSFIPEECILETDLLKPFFDKAGGLEKLMEYIPITEDEWKQAKNQKKQIARMCLNDIPRYYFASCCLISVHPRDRIGVQVVLSKVPLVVAWTPSD